MGLQEIGHIVGRGARLRCPRCGEGALFTGFFSMHTRCPHCALVFEREPGYFVGAIYVNYGATSLLAIAGFLALDYFAALSLLAQLLLWGGFAILFPLFFFRYSRSLWLSVDYIFSPVEGAANGKLLPLKRKPSQ